ncbi:GNAT family N-acetyltransferase [Tenacibaculum sp. 190130A14a]|uniref:(Ribosomal protein S5)-alanine N-acetyltransferase n=1 Tax=Tenacibaculum polynesiense TaxID=3137857 RepID=A0ABP1EY15_9FLAO
MENYLFTSDRLGFRNWKTSDIDELFELNSNEEVMRYFPSTQTKNQAKAFIQRMREQFDKNNFCYFAVETIETKEFIGFIGLSEQTYEIDFNPSIDIGWRLHPRHWGKGYATEGAKACLKHAFKTLKIKEIVSVAPAINIPSITVMEKIGMTKTKEFTHPLLKEFPKLENCVLYEIKNS